MEEVALRREWRVEREAACDVAALLGASVVASAPSGKASCRTCSSERSLDSVDSAGLGGGAMFSVEFPSLKAGWTIRSCRSADLVTNLAHAVGQSVPCCVEQAPAALHAILVAKLRVIANVHVTVASWVSYHGGALV